MVLLKVPRKPHQGGRKSMGSPPQSCTLKGWSSLPAWIQRLNAFEAVRLICFIYGLVYCRRELAA
jgi:hypothetical protein